MRPSSWLQSVADTLDQLLARLGLTREPLRDWPFDEAHIARYSLAKAGAGGEAIDTHTWRDLELTRYRTSLTQQTSVFGQQFLHHQLRCGTPAALRAETVNRLQDLISSANARTTLAHAFLPLRQTDTEISELLFTRPAASFPNWIRYVWLLPWGFMFGGAALLAAVLVPATSSTFLAGAAAASLIAFVLMLDVQRRFHAQVTQHQLEIRSLRLLLATVVSLNPAQAAEARRIHRTITPVPWLSLFPGLNEYADWFLLANIQRFRKASAVIDTHRALLQRCFEWAAQTEAELAIATHLAAAPTYCWSQPAATRALALASAVHPLLANTSPLTMSFAQQGALLTGQNGVGKSTLLKIIGVNLVVSRAFGCCYAEVANVPDGICMTSLNNEDSLENGESLYISELRRASELLAVTEHRADCICLIDEIFRGTNHVDAVAAAAAVLHALSERALIVVSSHHLVLAPLLTRSLVPYYLKLVPPAGESMRAARQLVPGVRPESNGISQLSAHGFDANLEADAIRIRDWLKTSLLPVAPPPTL